MLFWSAPSLQETDAWPPRAIYEADQLITNSRRCRQKWLFTVTFRHGRDHWQKDVGAGMPQRHRITGFAAVTVSLRACKRTKMNSAHTMIQEQTDILELNVSGRGCVRF